MTYDTTDTRLYHGQDITTGAIRTGYYAKAGKCRNPVCISRSTKGDFPVLAELAPPSSLLTRFKYIDHDEKAYAGSYTKHLDSLDWNGICSRVGRLIGKYGCITLLCFEKPGDFCHRHAAAARLCMEMLKAGLLQPDDIGEPGEDGPEKEEDLQPSLFG